MGLDILKGKLKHFILDALSKERLHGYLLMERIGKTCMNVWKPTAGSLYPALEELKSEGLIEVRKKSSTGRKKTEYAITGKGRKELARLAENAGQMRENMLKACKDPKLSKFMPEDGIFLFNMIHETLEKKLKRHKGTLLEFAMNARNGKVPAGERKKALKAFEKFLNEIGEINKGLGKS